MNQSECVIPILNVKDFAASMDYYVGKLGLKRNGTGAIRRRLVALRALLDSFFV
jgi:hypothetical protein